MMNAAVAKRLDALSIEKKQQHLNLTIFPVVAPDLEQPQHIMLIDALAENLIIVEEINKSGSVPELNVVNKSDQHVLLIDGEEVAGAKQNRVLNTSILLDKQGSTRIPVSCTEQGRWDYESETFYHSGNVMSNKARSRKSLSVSQSLAAEATYSSDQGEVWQSISELHEEAGTHSPSGAMNDAFEMRGDQLAPYLAAASVLPDQVGFVVFIDGKPVGGDIFATHAAFSRIAPQLMRSYAIDALVSNERNAEKVKRSMSKSFLKQFSQASETRFDSVGLGNDYRYQSSSILGSALVCKDTPVHMAIFSKDTGDKTHHITSSTRRRRSRNNLLRE